MPKKHEPAGPPPASRRTRTRTRTRTSTLTRARTRPRTRPLPLAGIILCIVSPFLAAETLDDFYQALLNRGVSQDQSSAIIGAFDEEVWESVPAETDLEALALSVAYAAEEGLATRDAEEIIAVTRSAATEIARLQELGFSRQEAARAGVRHTRSTIADLPGDGQAAAQPPGGPGELPPAAVESARRDLNRNRRNARDIRSRIPGVPSRNLPPTPFSPDTDSPDTDAPDSPELPGTPAGPE